MGGNCEEEKEIGNWFVNRSRVRSKSESSISFVCIQMKNRPPLYVYI